MKTHTNLLIVLVLLSTTAFASDNNGASKQLSKEFIELQVQQSMSVGIAVKSIIEHYPEHVELVVDTTLDLYPAKYKEIVHAAISAEPSLTKTIVETAIAKGVASCPSIVETAIVAEPSYVDFVVKAAANSTPEELIDIVRVSVVTEPDSADRIVQTLAESHPKRLGDIVETAVRAVPFVGEYIVDALLAVFHDEKEQEQVITAAVKQTKAEHNEYLEKILATAKNAGLDEDAIKKYALDAGAKPEEIAKVLNDEK